MQDSNPYNAPASPVADVDHPGEQQLADRGMRLVAAIIDTIIMLAVLVPLMFVGGYVSTIMSGQKPGFGTQAMWAGIGFLVFLVIQGYPLNATGQTWGKKLLKLRIVDLEGRKPEFSRLVSLRYLTTQVIALIPFLGTLYGLVNVLFIFGEDRRCLHDKIAGTRVVVE